MTVRLAVVGGSAPSTPQLIEALGAWSGEARAPSMEIVLLGRDPSRLELVAGECTRLISLSQASITVEAAIEPRGALEGADIILTQVRIGGLAAREFDETFPRRHGIPGEETMGPGGFANAFRTLPALERLWDDIEAAAPDALVVNLTNPAGMVHLAASRRAVRVVSVCESPIPMLEGIAGRLGTGLGAVLRRYVGLNHLGWFVPTDADELAAISDLALWVDRDAIAAHEALPAPYVRYYVHADRILADQERREPRAAELRRLQDATFARYRSADMSEGRPLRSAPWYRLAVLPLLAAWLGGSEEPFLAATLNAGMLPHLPPDAVIEVAHVAAEPGRLQALAPPVPPALPLSLLARHSLYEAAAVDAALERSEALCLRALMLNPMVVSFDQARGVLEDVLTGDPTTIRDTDQLRAESRRAPVPVGSRYASGRAG